MTAKVSASFSERHFHLTTLCVRYGQTDKRSLNWSKAQCAIFLLHNSWFSECTSFHCNLIFIKIESASISKSPARTGINWGTRKNNCPYLIFCRNGVHKKRNRTSEPKRSLKVLRQLYRTPENRILPVLFIHLAGGTLFFRLISSSSSYFSGYWATRAKLTKNKEQQLQPT